jgi:uncharacterized membrane protein YhaH (DUF805 family)
MAPPPSLRPSPASARRLSLDELSALAIGAEPGSMTVTQLYFRVRGRIARRTFWLHGVLSLLAASLFGYALLDIAGLTGTLGVKFLNLALAWPYIAISAKRLHDFDRSAWWMLVNFVPGVGSIVMLLANGATRGTRGANRFGAAPGGADRFGAAPGVANRFGAAPGVADRFGAAAGPTVVNTAH